MGVTFSYTACLKEEQDMLEDVCPNTPTSEGENEMKTLTQEEEKVEIQAVVPETPTTLCSSPKFRTRYDGINGLGEIGDCEASPITDAAARDRKSTDSTIQSLFDLQSPSAVRGTSPPLFKPTAAAPGEEDEFDKSRALGFSLPSTSSQQSPVRLKSHSDFEVSTYPRTPHPSPQGKYLALKNRNRMSPLVIKRRPSRLELFSQNEVVLHNFTDEDTDSDTENEFENRGVVETATDNKLKHGYLSTNHHVNSELRTGLSLEVDTSPTSFSTHPSSWGGTDTTYHNPIISCSPTSSRHTHGSSTASSGGRISSASTELALIDSRTAQRVRSSMRLFRKASSRAYTSITGKRWAIRG